MRVIPTPLDGVMVVYPDLRSDSRGAFFEAWHGPRYTQAGLPAQFIQCNVSRSALGVLRGLHLQHPHDQGKLVTVMQGAIYDVAADVRRGSPSFGRWFGIELTAEKGEQLYIPAGFAHGFLVLRENTVVMYLTTEVYEPNAEVVIRWDDPDLGITWPIPPREFSSRDASAPLLNEVADRLPRHQR
jgi:dTDP-4-dehydrorhamnose 3,5-epimerase